METEEQRFSIKERNSTYNMAISNLDTDIMIYKGLKNKVIQELRLPNFYLHMMDEAKGLTLKGFLKFFFLPLRLFFSLVKT